MIGTALDFLYGKKLARLNALALTPADRANGEDQVELFRAAGILTGCAILGIAGWTQQLPIFTVGGVAIATNFGRIITSTLLPARNDVAVLEQAERIMRARTTMALNRPQP